MSAENKETKKIVNFTPKLQQNSIHVAKRNAK